MRTCPHCQFLVADGAEGCSVCGQTMSAPPAPPTVAGARAFAAPGATATPTPGVAGASTPPPFAGWAPGTPPAGPGGYGTVPGMPAAAPAPRRPGWIVPVANELDWQGYEDPTGRFEVDLPGQAVMDRVDMPGAFGAEVSFEAVTVSDPTFRAVVGRSADLVLEGASFDDLAFSADAAERMVEAGGFEQAEVVEQLPVEGSAGAGLQFEMSGQVSGEPAVLFSRLVLVGSDLYELNIVGPEVHRDELVAMHGLASSFRTP